VKGWAGTALEPKAKETLWVGCTKGLQLSVTDTSPEALVTATGAGAAGVVRVVNISGAIPMGRLLLLCCAPLVSV